MVLLRALLLADMKAVKKAVQMAARKESSSVVPSAVDSEPYWAEPRAL